MNVRTLLRPRALGIAFGGYVAAIAIIAWWFANGPGAFYKYTPEVTFWCYGIYSILAGLLLASIGIVATGSLRQVDLRLLAPEPQGEEEREPAEDRYPQPEGEEGEEAVEPEESEEPEGYPPPEDEEPLEPDVVDHDIDELMEALGAIESTMAQSAGVTLEEFAPPLPPPTAPARIEPRPAARPLSRMIERAKLRREAVAAYFFGPLLLNTAIIGVSAILLPGADAFLQTYNHLNTAVLLGIAYSFWGIALYTGLSVYGILTQT